MKTCNRIIDLRDLFPGQPRPLAVQIALTYRCYYDCCHCYCSNQPKNELGFSFWKKVIDQIRSLGCVQLTFTGGDPMLHKDFPDIYRYARKSGFLVTIMSTGYGLNKKIYDVLENYPPFSIEITVNSLDKKNYERIIRTRNTFDRVMENIFEIKKRGLPLVIKCNALKENKGEILLIKKFAERLLGKNKFKFDLLILPGLNRERDPMRHRLLPHEGIAIVKNDAMMKARLLAYNRRLGRGMRKMLYRCMTGRSSFFIDPQGIMRPCAISNACVADLKNRSVGSGMKKFIKIERKEYGAKSKCVHCQYRAYCYICPARAYLETGHQAAHSDYYCQLARSIKIFLKKVRRKKVKKP